MRSPSQSRRGGSRRCARTAAGGVQPGARARPRPGQSSSAVLSTPAMPRSASVWGTNPWACGSRWCPCGGAAGRSGRCRRRGRRGPVLEHAARFAPVLAARGGRRREPPGALLRGGGLGLAGELVDAVADRAADPAVAEGHRRERHQGDGAGDHKRRRCRSGGARAAAAAPRLSRRSRAPAHQQEHHQERAAAELPGHALLDRERLGGDREGVLRQRPCARPLAAAVGGSDQPAACAAAAGRSRARRSCRSRRPRARRATGSAGSPRIADAQRRGRRARGRPRSRCGGCRARAGRGSPARPWCRPRSSTGTAGRSGWRSRSRRASPARRARRARRAPRRSRRARCRLMTSGRGARREPRGRDRGREDGQVGERAARLDVGEPGTTAQVTDRAVSAASAANSATLAAPWSGPGRLQSDRGGDDRRRRRSTASTSTIVVRLELAAARRHRRRRRRGRRRGLRQRREERGDGARGVGILDMSGRRAEQRDAAAQRDEQAGQRQQRRARSARAAAAVGRSLLALARSNRPLSPGLTVSPPTSTLGVLRVAVVVAGDRRQLLGCPCCARRLLLGDSAAGRSGPWPGAAAALVGSAGDRAGDDLAAVAVLVAVGRQVVERLLELGVRVVLVEVVVATQSVSALACAAAGSTSRANTPSKNRFRKTRITLRKSSSWWRAREDEGRMERDRHLPHRAAQASNRYGCDGVWLQPRLCPGSCHR